MRIARFYGENFKRLKVVEITPRGNVVRITGANAQGKSSILDGIFAALKVAEAGVVDPIRHGSQRATIKLDLGALVVTRQFRSGGTTSLTVEQADGGLLKSPQRVLDELLGALTFDPLAFVRMKPREQLETVRKVVSIDEDLDAIDAENAADYELRTQVNRVAKAAAARAEAVVVPPDAPAKVVDTSALLAEIERASAFNAAVERRTAERDERVREVSRLRGEVLRMQGEVEEMLRAVEVKRSQMESVRASADRMSLELEEVAPPEEPKDISAIRAKIQGADAANAAFRKREERRAAIAERDAAEKESADITDRMDARTARKSAAIARAKFPVPGLSFGDGEVVYNGVPFSQASQAEQLRVSMGVAMAANPKLRVLRIQDGSLLDSKSMALISEMADSSDFQFWIESVDESGKVGVVIEDGEVAADNQEKAL